MPIRYRQYHGSITDSDQLASSSSSHALAWLTASSGLMVTPAELAARSKLAVQCGWNVMRTGQVRWV